MRSILFEHETARFLASFLFNRHKMGIDALTNLDDTTNDNSKCVRAAFEPSRDLIQTDACTGNIMASIAHHMFKLQQLHLHTNRSS